MASALGFTSLTDLSFPFFVPKCYRAFYTEPNSRRISTRIWSHQNPSFVLKRKHPTAREFRLFKSVELEQFITSDDEDEMSEEFFEAIEELERMAREPSDILEEMNDRLSSRKLRLVLVYFSQEGRDSWCALEVFEWLKKENKLGEEVEGERDVVDVVDLLVDMDCVGLKPGFSMIEKVISMCWEMGKKERAVLFVKEVLKRGIACAEDDGGGHKEGPTGYLAWMMMVEGNNRDAVKLVIDLRESGLKPEVYSYLIAMTAVVKELDEFSKALRKLKGFARAGFVAELDMENVGLIEKYQSDLLADGVRLSGWAIEEGSSSLYGLIHERPLAMYICAGRALEAERQLWEMKLIKKYKLWIIKML
ncbi:hypothetical protein SLE2022_198130 [Rubroshorea leprosula]